MASVKITEQPKLEADITSFISRIKNSLSLSLELKLKGEFVDSMTHKNIAITQFNALNILVDGFSCYMFNTLSSEYANIIKEIESIFDECDLIDLLREENISHVNKGDYVTQINISDVISVNKSVRTKILHLIHRKTNLKFVCN